MPTASRGFSLDSLSWPCAPAIALHTSPCALHATFGSLLGGHDCRVVIHFRERKSGGLAEGHGVFLSPCDRVDIIWLGSDTDSPIVHIKNFGRDYGAASLS